MESPYRVRRVIRAKQNLPDINHENFCERLEDQLNTLHDSGYDIVETKIGNYDTVIIARMTSA